MRVFLCLGLLWTVAPGHIPTASPGSSLDHLFHQRTKALLATHEEESPGSEPGNTKQKADMRLFPGDHAEDVLVWDSDPDSTIPNPRGLGQGPGGPCTLVFSPTTDGRRYLPSLPKGCSGISVGITEVCRDAEQASRSRPWRSAEERNWAQSRTPRALLGPLRPGMQPLRASVSMAVSPVDRTGASMVCITHGLPGTGQRLQRHQLV